MPPRAAELAVGHGLQADVLLLADDALDLAVLDRGEIGRGNLIPGAPRPRLLEGRGAQQAPDVVGAERRLGALHPHTSCATSTIMASFAHCSCSARTLPSSVEAKPHCGDRQSWSSATYLVASSIRLSTSAFFSSVPVLVV